MRYTEKEIIDYLTSGGQDISSYLVITGSSKATENLYSIYKNLLFIEMISDNQIYLDAIEYIKKIGQVYESDDALRKARPELIFS